MKILLPLSAFIFSYIHSNAQNIFQQIKAEVISLDDYSNKLNNQLQLGDTIIGTISYSHDVIDSNADPAVGDYWYTSTPYGLTLHGPGNLLWQSDGNNVNFLCEAVNHAVVDGGDDIAFRSYSNYYSAGNNAADKLITWEVDNADGTNLSSDTVPLILDLSIWNQLYGLTIGADDFPDGSNGYFIRATVVEILTDEGTGLSNAGAEKHEEVFPNPAHSYFTIINPDANASLIIEDVNGKIVMTKTPVPSSVDVSDFSLGLYVVKIVGEKSTKVFKLVKS